jgi:putative Mg2+ transporter-C (MgtC) family protein
MVWEDTLRLLAAFAAGAAVGLDRELHDKPAGLRTNILICVGAALFTIVSARMAGDAPDPTRIASGIVAGVGFLGAGSIIQRRGNVHGMTTAATIWVVASIGMAFGAGSYGIACVATGAIIVVLRALHAIEDLLARWRTTESWEVVLSDHDGPEAREAVVHMARDAGLRLRKASLSRRGQRVRLTVNLVGQPARLEALAQRLLEDNRIESLRRS